MFKFIKQIFVSTMSFGSLSNAKPLECVSTNNQECKVRPQIVNINSNEHFILLVSKQANTVVVATILMIPIQNCVFLMWLKI